MSRITQEEAAGTFAAITILMNMADAMFTRLAIQTGAEELNPLMAAVISWGMWKFLVLKMVVVSALVFFVWAVGRKRTIPMVGLGLCSVVYSLLFFAHVVLR